VHPLRVLRFAVRGLGPRVRLNVRYGDAPFLSLPVVRRPVVRQVRLNVRNGGRQRLSFLPDLSGRYTAELQKPRIRLPSIVAIVGAAGIGVVIGRTIP
jgi:hypothetical protein